MFDKVHFIVDDTIYDAIFSDDEDKVSQVMKFLNFLKFRNELSDRIPCCETTPRIHRTCYEKTKNDLEVMFTIENFINKNGIASEEEELTKEQEIIELCNNTVLFKQSLVLLTEDPEKYGLSNDASGNTYKLRDDVLIVNLKKVCSFLDEYKEFQEFCTQNSASVSRVP